MHSRRLHQPTQQQLLKIITTILLWLILAIIILFLAPSSILVFTAFFTTLSLALIFTSRLLLKNRRHAFLITFAIVSWLILRALSLGTPLNAILLALLAVTVELTLKK